MHSLQKYISLRSAGWEGSRASMLANSSEADQRDHWLGDLLPAEWNICCLSHNRGRYYFHHIVPFLPILLPGALNLVFPCCGKLGKHCLTHHNFGLGRLSPNRRLFAVYDGARRFGHGVPISCASHLNFWMNCGPASPFRMWSVSA